MPSKEEPQIKVNGMTTEQKQVLLLNRLYRNIDTWKTYRFNFPSTICLAMFGLTAFFLKEAALRTTTIRIFMTAALVVILIGGMAIQYFIRFRYKTMADRIFYLYDRLGIDGEDYFQGKSYKNHRKGVLAFTVGYLAIAVTGIICLLFVWIAG